ncbi:MAG: spore maturation protein [Clostridia bacterium]|nr:spore maturation protein [Clostridia bacterium]
MNIFFLLLLLLLGVLFLCCGRRCTDAFLRGARTGLESAVRLLPTLLLFVCAVNLFRAGGCTALLVSLADGICERLHIPPGLLPLLVVRPISGSASTAVLSDLFSEYGPDSPVGLTASVICGASETVFYVLSVYCAGTPLRGTRYLLPAALAVMAITVCAALLVCGRCFGAG